MDNDANIPGQENMRQNMLRDGQHKANERALKPKLCKTKEAAAAFKAHFFLNFSTTASPRVGWP